MSFARRVVIDTGVLVSAAIRPESVPAPALEKVLLQFEVCASEETLAELETVLMRQKFDRYLIPDLRLAFITGIRERSSLFTSPKSSLTAPIRTTTNSSHWPKPRRRS